MIDQSIFVMYRPKLVTERVRYVKAFLGALSSIKELPPEQRAVTTITIVGLALTSSIAVVGVTAGVSLMNSAWGIPLAATSMIVGISGLGLSYRFATKKLPAANPKALHEASALGMSRNEVLSRVILNIPLSEDCQQRVRVRLHVLKDAIRLHLFDRGCSTPNIRVSVLLPDASRPDTNQIFQLAIPSGLHLGMDGHPDEHLRIPAKCGLAGYVYREESAYCYRTSDDHKPWVGGYELGPDIAHLVSPRLQWVIGWALLGTNDEIFGVVCADGLDEVVEPNILDDMMNIFGVKAMAISADFADVERRRLVVSLDP